MSEIVLVLAVADNGVIGKDGGIPWHISDDMKRFKALTLGHTVVMGRKTWDSLPKKPLPGRVNVVVTHQKDWHAEGAITASSLGQATSGTSGVVMIIGGAEIYERALPLASRGAYFRLRARTPNGELMILKCIFRATQYSHIRRRT